MRYFSSGLSKCESQDPFLTSLKNHLKFWKHFIIYLQHQKCYYTYGSMLFGVVWTKVSGLKAVVEIQQLVLGPIKRGGLGLEQTEMWKCLELLLTPGRRCQRDELIFRAIMLLNNHHDGANHSHRNKSGPRETISYDEGQAGLRRGK